MRFATFAATIIVALSSFTVAMPAPEANGISAPEPVDAPIIYEKRQCRANGSRCKLNRMFLHLCQLQDMSAVRVNIC